MTTGTSNLSKISTRPIPPIPGTGTCPTGGRVDRRMQEVKPTAYLQELNPVSGENLERPFSLDNMQA